MFSLFLRYPHLASEEHFWAYLLSHTPNARIGHVLVRFIAEKIPTGVASIRITPELITVFLPSSPAQDPLLEKPPVWMHRVLRISSTQTRTCTEWLAEWNTTFPDRPHVLSLRKEEE